MPSCLNRPTNLNKCFRVPKLQVGVLLCNRFQDRSFSKLNHTFKYINENNRGNVVDFDLMLMDGEGNYTSSQ